MITNFRKYVIELDGKTYRFSKGNLEQIDSPNDLAGDKYFVTDMQESISQTMTVDVEPRYAEVIAQKQVQESGEFDGPVTLIPHWKKRKGKNTTDIFFTAIPSHLSNLYTASDSEYDDNVMVFPLYSYLYGVLKRIRARGPVAVVFKHSRFADLIIGTRKKVYSVNRLVAFDSSEEQFLSLWETVKEEIKNVENANHIQVGKSYLVTWIDSGDLSAWTEDPERDLQLFKSEAVEFNGDVHRISFFRALKKVSLSDSVSPPLNKAFYCARKLAPALNVAFLGLIILLVCGFYSYRDKTDQLQTELRVLEKRIGATKFDLPEKLNKEMVEQTVAFIKNHSISKNASSFQEVINQISDGLSTDIELEVLKLDYLADGIQMKMFGRVNASFRRAQKEYRDFIGHLKRHGYVVEESRFDTEIKESRFIINLKKRVR